MNRTLTRIFEEEGIAVPLGIDDFQYKEIYKTLELTYISNGEDNHKRAIWSLFGGIFKFLHLLIGSTHQNSGVLRATIHSSIFLPSYFLVKYLIKARNAYNYLTITNKNKQKGNCKSQQCRVITE